MKKNDELVDIAPVVDPVDGAAPPPVAEPVLLEPVEVRSRVRDALERSTAWVQLANDPVVAPQLRYTNRGVEGVREMHPQLRARLYLMATAILDASGIYHDTQRELPFYARELPED